MEQRRTSGKQFPNLHRRGNLPHSRSKDNSYILANIRDKVVQDVDKTEGTGIWTCEEGVRLHVPIPTITLAHLFRLASADAARREKVKGIDGGI
jgi:6-phosphogluconate dehydrogenase